MSLNDSLVMDGKKAMQDQKYGEALKIFE